MNLCVACLNLSDIEQATDCYKLHLCSLRWNKEYKSNTCQLALVMLTIVSGRQATECHRLRLNIAKDKSREARKYGSLSDDYSCFNDYKQTNCRIRNSKPDSFQDRPNQE